jgi:DNA-binding NarL/FixJ family response regulator
LNRRISKVVVVPALSKPTNIEAVGCVLVADPEPISKMRIGQMVSRYRRVRFAGSRAEVLALFESHADWCGFVVDAAMHDREGDGLDLLSIARERWPATPALVVSFHLDRDLVNRAAVLGTSILATPFGEAELRPFLQRVIAHEHSFADAFAERLALATRTWKLSLREHEILAWHLAGGTRDEYLGTSGLSEGTFKTYVKRMLKKVGAQSLAEMTQIAFRRVLGTPVPFGATRGDADADSEADSEAG